MIRKIIFLLTLAWLAAGCDGVSDIFKSKKPELSDEGIVLSADRVSPLDTVAATIVATNPINGPLYYKWRASGGRYVEPDDRENVEWIAPVEGGDFKLTVKVSNDKDHVETSRWVHVISADSPLVDIQAPKENSYFILGQSVSVKAFAAHENGIARVRFFAKDSLFAEVSGNQTNMYQQALDLTNPALVGKTAIKVEAVAANQLAVTGSDEVVIEVGGIIQGKHGN